MQRLALLFFLYVRTLRKDKSWISSSVFHFIPSAAIVIFSLLLTLDNFWYKEVMELLLYYTVFYIGLYSWNFITD